MVETTIDRENDTYQILAALRSNRRKRMELGEIFVEGVAPLKAAFARALSPLRLIHQDGKQLSDWAKGILEAYPEAEHLRLSPPLMQKLSEREDCSEILATFARPRFRLDEIKTGRQPFILILDRPSNPGNLGSILRSADAFGVDFIIITGHSVDPWDPPCIRASLGAAFALPIVHVESSQALESWLANLRGTHPGLKIIGTDSDSTARLDSTALSPPIALLMGNEARGLSQRLKAASDQIVRIPMTGSVDSLNLACATTVFLYQILCNKMAGHPGPE